MALTRKQHQIRYQCLCAICLEPIDVESAETDEDGQAVHDDCYVKEICNGKKPCASAKNE